MYYSGSVFEYEEFLRRGLVLLLGVARDPFASGHATLGCSPKKNFLPSLTAFVVDFPSS